MTEATIDPTVTDTADPVEAARAAAAEAEARQAELARRLTDVDAEIARIEGALASGELAAPTADERTAAALRGETLPEPRAAARSRRDALVTARTELQNATARAADAAALARRRYADRLIAGPLAAKLEAIREQWAHGLQLLVKAARAEDELLAEVNERGADAPEVFVSVLPCVAREALVDDAAAIAALFDEQFAAAEVAREREAAAAAAAERARLRAADEQKAQQRRDELARWRAARLR